MVYDKAYRQEVERIQGLLLKKQVAEVGLFILSESPLNDDVKKGWTDDMVEFYESRVKESVNVKNQGDLASSSLSAMEDEVSKDNSAHASFMTQNNVSNVVHADIASMVDNGVATSTSSIL